MQIDEATAAKFSADYEKLQTEHRAHISECAAFGLVLADQRERLGVRKFKRLVNQPAWKIATPVPIAFIKGVKDAGVAQALGQHARAEGKAILWSDIEDLIENAQNPNIRRRTDPTKVEAFINRLAENNAPIVLTALVDQLKTKLVELGLQQYELGERLVDLRGQLGELAFKNALARQCPAIPWENAERYMNAALDSHLAQLVELADRDLI